MHDEALDECDKPEAQAVVIGAPPLPSAVTDWRAMVMDGSFHLQGWMRVPVGPPVAGVACVRGFIETVHAISDAQAAAGLAAIILDQVPLELAENVALALQERIARERAVPIIASSRDATTAH